MACGGVKDSHASKQAYIVSNDKLCRVEDMGKCRAFHALLYYDFTHAIYAFGGAVGACSKLSTCEKFDIITMKWSNLSDMTGLKSHICACQHLAIAYIIGDGQIETFNLVTEEFKALLKVVSPVDVQFAAVVRDEIVIVASNSLQKVRISDWKITYMWRDDYSQSASGLQHTTLHILHSNLLSRFNCLTCEEPETQPFSLYS